MTGPGEKPVQNIPTSLETYPPVSIRIGNIDFVCKRDAHGEWWCAGEGAFGQVSIVKAAALWDGVFK